MRRRAVLLLIAVLGLRVSVARAQVVHDELEPRAHFQAGLSAARDGDLATALREFEAAYVAQPHFSVLYNIGRARAGLGRHTDAIAAFERYLLDGGAQVPEARRAEVRSLLEISRRQIGAVEIVAPEADATRVWLDGRELDRRELGQPLPLSVGSHSLIHSIRGSAPISETVEVRPATTTQVALTPPAATPLGDLHVHCDVPEVEVFVNGVSRGRTPLAGPLRLPAGNLQLHFSRPGYYVVERRFELEANASTVQDCGQRALSKLPFEVEARLKLSIEPVDSEAFVDGERFGGRPLPSGPHDLSIRRDGFVPMSKRIILSAQRTTEYAVTLKPTASYAARRRDAIVHRHRVGYALAGVGAALLAASAGIYIWNDGRYDRWRSGADRDLQRAISIQRFDDLALGLLLVGAGATTGGVWLSFSRPSAEAE